MRGKYHIFLRRPSIMNKKIITTLLLTFSVLLAQPDWEDNPGGYQNIAVYSAVIVLLYFLFTFIILSCKFRLLFKRR